MKLAHSAFAAQAAYSDSRAVEARVRSFLPMVRKAAWHIYGSGRDGLEVEDLIQIGMMALTECARRHNGDGEDGFAAYAKLRVRGAMFDHLRQMSPDSRGAMKRKREVEAARSAFQMREGRSPTLAELAEATGSDPASVGAIEAEGNTLHSLDTTYDESSADYADADPDPFMALVEARQGDLLANHISRLPERLQMVLQLYFVEELNLAEIAAVLEVSVPRVHQLKAAALDRLRESLPSR